ncbi:unnamed protein product [Zymoseptoria tritici ST99CH_1A5]|uniref:Uncharacterized protein n=1 Tax=Zymoseptoria tritici ST99CH_1A5 TaxID=1276529 RepID=A0A1Y6LX63_ZYMTR|nr:unnamed protein product [Zymoseptoria tritici ST99CH_1A5]
MDPSHSLTTSRKRGRPSGTVGASLSTKRQRIETSMASEALRSEIRNHLPPAQTPWQVDHLYDDIYDNAMMLAIQELWFQRTGERMVLEPRYHVAEREEEDETTPSRRHHGEEEIMVEEPGFGDTPSADERMSVISIGADQRSRSNTLEGDVEGQALHGLGLPIAGMGSGVFAGVEYPDLPRSRSRHSDMETPEVDDGVFPCLDTGPSPGGTPEPEMREVSSPVDAATKAKEDAAAWEKTVVKAIRNDRMFCMRHFIGMAKEYLYGGRN